MINENLTWNDHISAIKAKMSRYVGVLYKLKKLLPLSARKNIFHSFVQSHLNFCSLVWGLGAKANIEPLFSEQKKAMRALMPGFTVNYYKDGVIPCHTKPFFTEYNIQTIHSIILTNILVFMHKYHSHNLPSSVLSIISPEAPKISQSNENCKEWMTNHSIGILRNAISFKGPLFYLNYFPEILSQCEDENKQNSIYTSSNSFKNRAKAFVLNMQARGCPNEWEGNNMPLYHLPSLPRNHRKNIPLISYHGQ